MLSMTKWANIIVKNLNYPSSVKSISEQIKRECLLTTKKINGAYQIDHDKVWNTIILSSPECVKRLDELQIDDVLEMESWQYEREYQMMHRSARSAFKKIRR